MASPIKKAVSYTHLDVSKRPRQPFRERAALHGQDSAGACGSLAVVQPAGRDEKLGGGLRKRLEKR